MSLKSDDYDPIETVKRLIDEARFHLGPSTWRMVGPELTAFIMHEVAGALHEAFSRAEALYINDAIKRSGQMSLTILEGVLAGVEIGKEADEDGS